MTFTIIGSEPADVDDFRRFVTWDFSCQADRPACYHVLFALMLLKPFTLKAANYYPAKHTVDAIDIVERR